MTSFFTTGGIRGEEEDGQVLSAQLQHGCAAGSVPSPGRILADALREDIDFSIRIFKGGYTCRLFPVPGYTISAGQTSGSSSSRYTIRDCPHQSVQKVSGITEARPPAAGCIYPGWPYSCWERPSARTACCPSLFMRFWYAMDSTIRNRSLSIGLYSVAASFIQLIGCGTGFLQAPGGTAAYLAGTSSRRSKELFTNRRIRG